MRVGATKEGLSGQTGWTPREAVAAPAAAVAHESRALVVVEPPAERPRRAIHREAPFLAQLIATKAQHPQTRVRRRAEPDEAIAAYRATAELVER